MFSAAFTAEFESLAHLALRTLTNLVEHAESESVRAQCSLGILRITERMARKLPLPEGGGRGEGSRLPQSSERASAPPSASAIDSDPRPPRSSAAPPLSESEIADLLRIYPHLEHHRVRRPRLAKMWRRQLAEGQFWLDYWAEPTDHPDPPALPNAPDQSTDLTALATDSS